MSALRMAATTLWTQLVDAMRADGIIAQCITQSGPATNAVITEAVSLVVRPWLPMSITPRPGREVIGISNRNGKLYVIHYEDDAWWYSDNSAVGDAIVAYTFIDTSGAPK